MSYLNFSCGVCKVKLSCGVHHGLGAVASFIAFQGAKALFVVTTLPSWGGLALSCIALGYTVSVISKKLMGRCQRIGSNHSVKSVRIEDAKENVKFGMRRIDIVFLVRRNPCDKIQGVANLILQHLNQFGSGYNVHYTDLDTPLKKEIGERMACVVFFYRHVDPRPFEARVQGNAAAVWMRNSGISPQTKQHVIVYTPEDVVLQDPPGPPFIIHPWVSRTGIITEVPKGILDAIRDTLA